MRILSVIGALTLVAAIGAGVYFFGGFYNVAANVEDPAAVAWALVRVREASVARHAEATPPGSLDDPARIRAGARAFAAQGCANCHGAPGVGWAKYSEGLNPSPPDLKTEAQDLRPNELFWMIKNGIRMTGMPSFGAIGVSDADIWAIAAFVKALPRVSEADYRSWSSAAPNP